MEAKPPPPHPWASEIYVFHGVFRPQWVLIPPPWKKKEKCKPPSGQIMITPMNPELYISKECIRFVRRSP